MTMVGPQMSMTMLGLGTGKGMVGKDFSNLCDAVGNGTCNSLKGAAFQTVDTGTTPGVGAGAGVGLKAVIAGQVSQMIFVGCMVAFGSAGPDLMDLCDVAGKAYVATLGMATLASQHPLVFAGVAAIVPGSIQVPAAAIGGMITAEGLKVAFMGKNWPDFADVVSDCYSKALLLATGQLTITGSPTATPTSPGAGVGQGTMS